MKARAEQRARVLSLIRLYCLGAVLVVVVLLMAWEFFSGGRASTLAARVLGRGDMTERAIALNDAIDASLVSLGMNGVKSSFEEAHDERRVWRRWEKSGTIPPGVGAFDCNSTITRAVREAGGCIVRVAESGPDWQGALTVDMRFGTGGVETHHLVLKESDTAAGRRSAGPGDGTPRVAIIIDDLGYNMADVVQGFLKLDFPLAVSILPGTPYASALANEAFDAGKEVLVHIPMEPASYPQTNPGEGALLLEYPYTRIAALTAENIDAVPHAIGANNHMGSAFTLDRARMRTVMSVVSDRGLFYVDSMTTPESRGFPEAERAGVPTVRNNMFIDSLLDEQGRIDVRTQLSALEDIARKRGFGVGIGHPHPETLKVLRSELPLMAERGIKIVFVSELATGVAH